MMDDTIFTSRLILRKFVISDAHGMFSTWANDNEVTKYLTWLPHSDISQTRDIIAFWIKEYESSLTYRYAITLKENKKLIGSIDVVSYHEGNPEIGYVLGKEYWNKGYMSEALLAITNNLFSHGFNKILIRADANNIASNKVISKVGFKYLYTKREICSRFKPYEVDIKYYELDK